MAKIDLPRLPDAKPEYNQVQFDQMIRVLEQMILTLNTNYQPIITEDKAEAEIWFMMRGGC